MKGMNHVIMDESVVIDMDLIEELHFDEQGLIPAVISDYVTKDVLMLAYMSKESLRISLEKGLSCFYSRTKEKFWLKGSSSGNYQRIASITTDCGKKALLVAVKPLGPTCHLGNYSCFEQKLYHNPAFHEFSVNKLMECLQVHKKKMPSDSYAVELFQKGVDEILRKIKEECDKVIIAGKSTNENRLMEGIADLYYHMCILMVEMGIGVEGVSGQLAHKCCKKGLEDLD